MAEGIENADVVCCFMTPDYQKSRNCKLELEYAYKRGIRIIPCMIGDKNDRQWTSSSWLGLITSGLNYINFRDDSDFKIQSQAIELMKRIKNQSSVPTAESILSPVKLFESIRQKYLRDSTIKRIMNEESLPIEESYINLAIVETKEQQEKEKKLKQHDQENEQNNHLQQHNEKILSTFEEIYGTKTPIDVKDIFKTCEDKTRKVLILGRAGIGKSTFCQYVTYRWAKGEIWSEYDLTVLIQLRKLNENRYPSGENYSPIDIIKKEYFPFGDLSNEEKQRFKEQCNAEKVLWILDGYDEFVQNIPEQLKDVFDYIRETQHHILTSRPYGITLLYRVKMEITGFADDNIVKYVQQFFDQIKDEITKSSVRGQNLLTFLKSNPSIWGIVHVPVNLELICCLWANNNWSEMKILTMTALYDNIIEWLCRRYLRRHNINDEEMTKQNVYKKCDSELQFLEHLAFKAMEYNKIILPPELLEETENETECCLVDHPQLLNMGILKSFDNKPVGNRNQTTKEHYFVHLSFQEHFAARHLLRTLKSSTLKNASRLINDNKYKQHFQLVFIFASGLLAQSYYKSCLEPFWTIIQGEPLDLVGFKHIKLIIQCVDELGDQTVFPQRANYLRSICQWFDICIRANASVIIENLVRSFQRTNSLLNKPLIQNKFIELMTTPDTVTKSKILHIIPQLTISEPTPKLLSTILTALQDKDSSVRKNACEVLGNIGERAATNDVIAGLIDALRDEDMNVRNSACEAFGNMSEKAAINGMIACLIDALQDKDSTVKMHACFALSKIGEKAATDDVIAGLIDALRDKDSEVRFYACFALSTIGEKAATNDVIARLVNALQDKDSNIRMYACFALSKITEKPATDDMIASLIDALRDEEADVRRIACEALGNVVGEKAATNGVIAHLIDAFQDEDLDVRKSACDALGNISEVAPTNDIVAHLIDALRDKDWDVRESACEWLGRIGEKGVTNDIIARLMDALQDEESHVRKGVCKALGNMGEKVGTHDMITCLIDTLQDKDSDTRMYACFALSTIGKKAPTNGMILGLVDALRDEDLAVKEGAYGALRNIGEKAATNDVIARLIDTLQDKDADARMYACFALSDICKKAVTNDVITRLINALQDEASDVRRSACFALSNIGEKAATNDVIAHLIAALHDEDLNVKKGACSALSGIGVKVGTYDVIARLNDALRDVDSSVRKSVCEALGIIGKKIATNDMITRLNDALWDEDLDVRKSACEALGNIGEKAATNDVITRLIDTRQDKDLGMRMYARSALGNIGEKAPTSDVIVALVNSFSGNVHDPDDDLQESQALEQSICSYTAIEELDSNMIVKLYSCIRHFTNIKLTAIPRDQWIKVFAETRNEAWLPLVKYAALLQGVAITVVEDRVIFYDTEKVSEFMLDHELVETFLKLFRTPICQ